MSKPDIQQQFFEQIKKILPHNLSLADSIAEVLSISTDSAYRRIRGEKMLSLEEVQILAKHFHFSVDQVLNLNTHTTFFNGKFIEAEDFRFESFLEEMLSQIEYVNSFERKEITYFSKDVPIFQYFLFPELAAFKFFIWMKTLFKDSRITGRYEMKDILNPLLHISKKMAELYTQIPSIEILSPQNTVTTLWQIEYYHDAQLFESKDEIQLLYDRLDDMINHIEKQAEEGKKFLPGQLPGPQSASYKLYINDFVVGDNTNIVQLNDTRICYINHNTINYFTTSDERFVDYTWQFIQNVIRKSVPISVVGEKERSIFFNITRQDINNHRLKYRENYISAL